MKWMRNIKTASKIIMLVFVMLVLMGIIAFAGYSSSDDISKDMDDLYSNDAVPAILLGEIRALVAANRKVLLSSLITNKMDVVGQNKNLYNDNLAVIDKNYKDYTATVMDDHEKAEMEKIREVRAKMLASHSELLSLLLKGQGQEAASMAQDPIVVGYGNEYDSILHNLSKYLSERAKQANITSGEEARRSKYLVIGISIFSLVSGLLAAFITAKSITNPLIKMSETVGEFAQGDLSADFETYGRDEVSDMGRSLKSMKEKLSSVISSVLEASKHISEAAEEFSAMAQETNASVEEFKANVDDMSRSMSEMSSSGEEITASVQEVAAGAQATAQKGTDIATGVNEAMKAGDEGMDAVRSASSGIGEVAEDSKAATKAVQELGNNARQIQNFVSQIGGIADQTNLLALNAAIEAARAGEAGRGFAVVAEEVRKLAEDSNVAAKSIASLAASIASDLEKVVGSAITNAKNSEEARGLASDTEGKIKNMLEQLTLMSNSTQDLAAVSQEQAASSEEIAEAVQDMSKRIGKSADTTNNIRHNVDEVAVAAERVAVSAEELSQLSSVLQKELSFFRMSGGESSVKLSSRPRRALTAGLN